MNTLLLQPSDTLFFRDGRPMSGSLAGHGAAWPLPTVTNAALHAALHRALVDETIGDVKVFGHNQVRLNNGQRETIREGDRKFGSLTTAGPFPVSPQGRWFFPRPLDAGKLGSSKVTMAPLAEFNPDHSSLPKPLLYPVTNTEKPSKQSPHDWWSREAWAAYLEGREIFHATSASDEPDPNFNHDSHFSDAEHNIGIGLDDDTDTQDGKRFFSSHSLRLRDDWKLGLLASAPDGCGEKRESTRDLIEHLFGSERHVIIGGQQRACSVIRTIDPLHLPVGKSEGFEHNGKFLLKWVLLGPAIFPEIYPGVSKAGRPIPPHHGGWLPNWIDLQGDVQLLDGPGKNYARRHMVREGQRIEAKLVAAITGKPIPVTGYAVDNGLADRQPGPKSAHHAVPPGSVYYFECTGEGAARKLAAALNWHGSNPLEIQNRRSTIFGEKGFGLGVCGIWKSRKN